MNNTRQCPECSGLMEKISSWWIEVDCCNNCDGMFFDFHELWTIVEKSKNMMNNFSELQYWDNTKNHIDRIYKCPKCNEEMEEHQYLYNSWIYIDSCNNCKWVYLNSWELENITNFIISQQSVELKANNQIQNLQVESIEDSFGTENERIKTIKSVIDYFKFF